MRILYIDPVGADAFEHEMYDALLAVKGPDTSLDLVALPVGRPRHLEYHSYEAIIIPDITHIVMQEAPHYDGIVIGCFYDVGLREAREVSGTDTGHRPLPGYDEHCRRLGQFLLRPRDPEQVHPENAGEHPPVRPERTAGLHAPARAGRA